jgi:hypothetical protein
VVGVNGDLIEQYLAWLRADLRTPAERTAEILAEAEDHLRESVEAGIAIGMTELEAQEAAISAFGSVRAVVKAHRRPRSAVRADVALAALKLAAIYLLTVPAVDAVLTTFFYEIRHLTTWTPGPQPYGMIGTTGVPDADSLVAGLSGSALAGLALLLGYRRVRRSRRRRGHPAVAPLGGFFPFVAATFMLLAGPAAGALIAPHVHLPRGYATLGAAGVVASVLVALGYTASMVLTIVRERHDGGTNDQGVPYAG